MFASRSPSLCMCAIHMYVWYTYVCIFKQCTKYPSYLSHFRSKIHHAMFSACVRDTINMFNNPKLIYREAHGKY
jgi:hypothetical protein